jgi:hypothetical protein
VAAAEGAASAGEDAAAEATTRPGVVGRAVRVASSLVSVHLELAKQEVAADRARLVSGLVFVAVGATLLVLVLLLLHAAAVAWCGARFALPLHLAILAVAGVDLALGLVCLLIARSRMRAPLLPKTRGQVQKTLAALTSP